MKITSLSILASLLILAPVGSASFAATPSACGEPQPRQSATALASFDANQGPLKVGEAVETRFESPHPYGGVMSFEPLLVFTQEIHHPGATYIAPHFERFELAEGDFVVVRAPDFSRSWTYEGFGKGDLGREGNDGFWGIHITGERAVIELWSKGERGGWGFAIDRYARGYTPEEMGYAPDQPEAICGIDDKENAICYELSEPEVYEKAQAVARLLIQGVSACTGWLVGDEGHLMTNEHCVGSPSAAMNTDYQFAYEEDDCPTNPGCTGVIEATQATLIKVSAPLDYSLVLLPVNPTATYGFLQLRETGAVLEERIYSPQHPGARCKEIAVVSTHAQNPSGFAEVDSLTEAPCSGGTADVGYMMDTEGGSSGSPVLGYSDHLVVSLHHCAFCLNRGVPIQDVIADLGPDLPNNALGGGLIFADGFESGDTSAWSTAVP